ncbi:unnamed protein product [Ostreobium quekettii]|uniref:RRM domain-containing protein n=1 Tax=Ostreobium quekettii TaxID=121088 RepID=A0A8S1IUP5_9CHLO|nr:unnamed protein product [Ostreobium quekettii]|eukprot:evm.model.scf_1026.2 EVM.evm.TU.scf_1026.2   scf_1026:12617-19874(-)
MPMSGPDGPSFPCDDGMQLAPAWRSTCAGPVRDIQISPQGVVAAATEGGVRLYTGERDFELRHELRTCPAGITAFAFSRSGQEVITGANDGFLKWWDVHTGEEMASTQFPAAKGDEEGEEEGAGGQAPPVSALACSKEGELVAATGGRSVCIFGHGGVHLHTIEQLISAVVAMEWRSSYELAVIVGSGIQMFTITEDKCDVGAGLSAENGGGSLTAVASAPGGKLLAAGCSNGSVQIWNLENEEEQSLVSVKGIQNTYDAEVGCLAWDESGSFLATAGGSEVIVWDMGDNGTDAKDGKDDYIVCIGHEKKAKITALAFQPAGKLLATGANDSQIVVFNSTNFSMGTSENMGRGLVPSFSSGRAVPDGNGGAVTAIAWHPTGLVFVGTSTGSIGAFDVVPGVESVPAKKDIPSGETPFLIPQNDYVMPSVPIPEPAPQNTHRRTPRRGMGHGPMGMGWAGVPLIEGSPGGESHSMGQERWTFGHRKVTNGGNAGVAGKKGPRHPPPTGRGMFNPDKPARPHYPEGAQAWPTTVMHPGMSVMRWPPVAYSPQMQYPGYMPQQVPQAPVVPPYGVPHNSQTGFVKQIAMPGGPSVPRIPMPPQPGAQYQMAYVPYPQPYQMAYPPQYFTYMGPQHMQDQMPPHPPPVMGPGGMPNPAGQGPNSKGLQREASSNDLNEDATSKSSERTNNGVNSMGPVTPSESSTSYDQDNGRMSQGVVTLYIGNLAPNVDENLLLNYFAVFGQITNVQVIRDRDTKQSRGFAFITYGHPYFAQTAMTNMDGATIPGPFEGRRLKVAFSNRRP